MNDDLFGTDDVELDRRRKWEDFTRAARAWAAGDPELARDLIRRHPVVRSELQRFAFAIRAGNITEVAPGTFKAAREER